MGSGCLEKHYQNCKLHSHTKKESFWYRDILKVLDAYKGMAAVNIQDGSTCYFWTDLWEDN